MRPPRQYRDETQWLISYKSVRAFIGWTGIALPLVLMGVGALVASFAAYRWEGSGLLETSLSDYHGSPMRNVFVGMLTAIGVFLLAYKGHDTRDNWMSTLAGAMAVLVAVFPDDCDAPLTGICTMDSFAGPLADVPLIESGTIHFAAAITLFVVMGAMCIFQFTRIKDGKPAWPVWRDLSLSKRRRNTAFVASGAIIWACILFLAGHFLLVDGEDHALLIAESIMVIAFGFAWQLKGEAGRNVKKPWIAWLFRPYQRWFWPE